MKWILALLLLVAPSLTAQTWFKVALEDPNVRVVLPAGTSYRLGIGTCWSGTVVTTVSTPLSVYYPSGDFPFDDPCPNVQKELDVLETGKPQVITVNGTDVAVPALPPSVLTSWTLTGCVLDIYSDGTAKIRDGCVASHP